MPLIATPGDPDANSFFTVERGDELAAERAHSGAWAAMDPDEKAAAAITGSRALSARVTWCGVAANEDQALAFPRMGLTRNGGYVVSDTGIPLEIELAAFEYALLLAPADVTVESEISALGLTKLKAGSVELGFREEASGYKAVPENVLRLIPREWVCEDMTGKQTILFRMI